ncbi:unnamed protein product [Plutella xylostella]|uniref:Arginyl-tRNA--protein transferase 1 n=1 Tax=Plutella xylostella TaxID=51655 RepID=A0A8S4E937_PLUXY|nr:unnamed protein product [Plutella xylostella]
MSSNLKSIVEYHGPHDNYKCGYCKSSDTNFSDGMWAHVLTVSDYQDLIDRGWRRSGQYCYKPTMNVVCCPMYTIRCAVSDFKPTKSQKKVLKRFNKHLTGGSSSEVQSGESRKMSTCSTESDATNDAETAAGEGGEVFVESNKTHQDINVGDVIASFEEQEKMDADTKDETEKSGTSNSSTEQRISDAIQQKALKKGLGADPEKAPCKKAKQLRKERKLEKLKEKGIDISTLQNTNNSKNKEKQIEDFINDLPEDLKNKVEVKLVRTSPPSPEWIATAKETYAVYVKYQTVVHNDKPEKFSQFKNFLVESPLVEEYRANGPPCGYGSFHQQYWLGGSLVAVGVVDILPACVSSVYFFYDPQYMHLTLGTYGALREIAFTRHLHNVAPDLKYYYMGYYIHSCRKMRYKGNFTPSYLLCPETYKWFPIKDCIPKLEAAKYCRLNPDLDDIDENFPKESDIGYIPVWVNGIVMHHRVYKRKFSNKVIEEDEELMKYAKLVGSKSTKSLILVK